MFFSTLNQEKTKIELKQTHYPRVRNHLSSLQMMYSDIRFWCSTRTNKAKWNENIAKSFIKLIQFNREEWKRNELMNPHSNKWPMESMCVRLYLIRQGMRINQAKRRQRGKKQSRKMCEIVLGKSSTPLNTQFSAWILFIQCQLHFFALISHRIAFRFVDFWYFNHFISSFWIN